MVDQVKLNQLHRLLNLALGPDNANVFWKNYTKKPLNTLMTKIPQVSEPLSILPKHIEAMQKQWQPPNKNAYFSNATYFVPFLEGIGQLATDIVKDATAKSSSIGKIIQKLSDNRQPLTNRFYQTLSPLAKLGNKSELEQNHLIDQVCDQLTDLYSENANIQLLPNTLVIQQKLAEQKLKTDLGINDNSKRLIYLYSNLTPDEAFPGIKAPGKKLALKGQGGALDIDIQHNNSRYLVARHNLDPAEINNYKYVYALDIPSASQIPVDTFYLRTIPNGSLIAQAIEGRQIVASFNIEQQDNSLKCINIKKNPLYAAKMTLNNPSNDNNNNLPNLLFRGDSRHFSGNPEKNTVHEFESNHAKIIKQKPPVNLFEDGFTSLVNFNDDAEKYVISRQPTIFISTSDDLASCMKFPEESNSESTRYVYVIYPPDSAVNAQELTNSDHAKTDREYLVPNHIPADHIIGMCTITNGELKQFDFNDNTKVNIEDTSTFVRQLIEPTLQSKTKTPNITQSQEKVRDGKEEKENDFSPKSP